MSTITNSHYDVASLDRTLSFLSSPDLSTQEKQSWKTQISHFLGKIVLIIKRVWNYCFGDHCWHDESFAHALVKYHISKMSSDPTYALENEQLDKVYTIYQRLLLIEKNPGVKWGDDLPIRFLGSFESILRSFYFLKIGHRKYTQQIYAGVDASIKKLDLEKVHNSGLQAASVAVEAGRRTLNLANEFKNLSKADQNRLIETMIGYTSFLFDLQASFADDLIGGKFVVVLSQSNVELPIDEQRRAGIENAQKEIQELMTEFREAINERSDGLYKGMITQFSSDGLDLLPRILLTLGNLFRAENQCTWDYSPYNTLFHYTEALKVFESLGFPSEKVWRVWSQFSEMQSVSNLEVLWKGNNVNRIGLYLEFLRAEGQVSSSLLQCTFEMAKKLKTVDLLAEYYSYFPLIDDQVLTVMAKNCQLTSLRIDRCQNLIDHVHDRILDEQDDNGISSLGIRNLETIKSLTSLHLGVLRISEDVIETLSQLSKLKKLYLSGILIGDNSTSFEKLGQMNSLRELTFLMDSLSSMTAPESLQGRVNNEGALKSFINAVGNLTSLTKLLLSGEFSITHELDQLTSLKELVLSCAADSILVTLFTELEVFKSRSITSDKQVKTICQLSHLRVLDIRTLNHVTTWGLTHLSTCASLQNLSMTVKNAVDDEWFKQVCQIPSLTRLEITDGSQLTEEGAKSISSLRDIKRIRIDEASTSVQKAIRTHLKSGVSSNFGNTLFF